MSSTSEFENRRNALIAEITAAFDGVSREDGMTLHEVEAMDNWESPEEMRAARRLDLEQRWQDVPDNDILTCCSALSFLCEKGFRYYLPAFMVFGLKHLEKDPNGIAHSCQYHLLYERSKSLRKSEPSSIAGKYGFTSAQCKAVAGFLRFYIDFNERTTDLVEVQAVGKWEGFCAEE